MTELGGGRARIYIMISSGFAIIHLYTSNLGCLKGGGLKPLFGLLTVPYYDLKLTIGIFCGEHDMHMPRDKHRHTSKFVGRKIPPSIITHYINMH
jgi:hypothetical protein